MFRAAALILCGFAALAPCASLLAGGPAAGIRVKVELDFGPAGKKEVKKEIVLKAGATVTDATKAIVELKQGFVCCDAKDVEAIGGVKCDPEKEGWWLYEINGEKGPVSAHRFLLEDGDRIVWRYRERGSLVRGKTVPYRVTGHGKGALEGVVGVAGGTPDLPPFKVHKNAAYCGEAKKPHPCARSSRDGRLSGAVVWLSGVREGKAWEKAEAPVLDQRHCEFVPHLVVARRGERLEIKSGDAVLHTVQAVDMEHKTLFNLAMPGTASRHEVTLSDAGVWDLSCGAGHRWMKAHLIVVESPYWTVVDEAGAWRLEGVPPGDYVLNVWHDLYGLEKRKVSVKAGRNTQEVVFPADRFRIDLRYAGAN